MLRYSSCHPTLSRYPRNALAGPRIWLGRDEACEDNKKSANLIYWFWALTFLLIAMPAGWRILLGLPMCGVRGGRRAPQLLQDEYESKIARAESDFSLRSALIQSSKLAKSNFSQSLGICRSSRCLWKFLSTPLGGRRLPLCHLGVQKLAKAWCMCEGSSPKVWCAMWNGRKSGNNSSNWRVILCPAWWKTCPTEFPQWTLVPIIPNDYSREK